MMNLSKTKIARENYTVGTISEMFERGILREDHPLQRRPGQHANDWRDSYIVTVIKNEDFDPIKICEQIYSGSVTNWLIDGVQRLTNIKCYKHNVYKLGKNIETPIVCYQVAKKDEYGHFLTDEDGNPAYETVEFDLRGKYYKELPRELQIQFDRCPVDVVKHLDCTDEEVGYHIRRYNHSKNMNNNQIGVTYSEKRGAEIKNISLENKFFVECGKFTPTEIKNGTIERVVMESVVSAFHTDDWKKQSKSMGAYINENVTKEEFFKLNDYFTRLIPYCEGKYQSIFNSKNTFIFIAVFDRFTKFGLEDRNFAEFLDAFEEDLHNKEIELDIETVLSWDKLNENRATKDKSVVVRKIKFLEKLMLDYFGIDEEEIKSSNASLIDFIKESVDSEVTIEDVEDYESDFEIITLDVDNESKLLNDENHKSLIAMIAYGYKEDMSSEVHEWLIDYFNRNNIYIVNQKKNYLHMMRDFEEYINAA